MLRSFFGKIHGGLSMFTSKRSPPSLGYFNEHSLHTSTKVPDDVMEGHFAVVAKKGEETKRFIVELHYLTDPAFLGLLELAREEYGFKQKGALVIPCHPQELEKVLDVSRLGDESARDIWRRHFTFPFTGHCDAPCRCI